MSSAMMPAPLAHSATRKARGASASGTGSDSKKMARQLCRGDGREYRRRAALTGRTLARAECIIAIAHPDFRAQPGFERQDLNA